MPILYPPFLDVNTESIWWKNCMRWIENKVSEHKTIAWDFNRNQPQRIYSYDGKCLFWLIYQTNFTFFQAEEYMDDIRDCLICAGEKPEDITTLYYSMRFYRLFAIIIADAVLHGINTIETIWDQYQMELLKGEIRLIKPDEFLLPWEIDEFYGIDEPFELLDKQSAGDVIPIPF